MAQNDICWKEEIVLQNLWLTGFSSKPYMIMPKGMIYNVTVHAIKKMTVYLDYDSNYEV